MRAVSTIEPVARDAGPDDPSNRPTELAQYGAGGQWPPGSDRFGTAGQPGITEQLEAQSAPTPWYRKRAVLAGWGALVLLLIALIVYGLIELATGGGGGGVPSTTSSTTTTTTTTTTPTTSSTTTSSSESSAPPPAGGATEPPQQVPQPSGQQPPRRPHLPEQIPRLPLPSVITIPQVPTVITLPPHLGR
ncbi:hypothetical protein H7H69_14460 [Mycobacterium heckeshornense]|nr:hypothetical protein [Mycobacterium heckeshornense]